MSRSNQVESRKKLHSMHQDLSDWSVMLNAKEDKQTLYCDGSSLSLLHQTISLYSNNYRPLSISFQQYESENQTTFAISNEPIISNSSNSIHCQLQLLALKLSCASNLKLFEVENNKDALGAGQVCNSNFIQVKKILSAPATASPLRSEEEVADDPYSAKLDSILESDELNFPFTFAADTTPPNTPSFQIITFDNTIEKVHATTLQQSLHDLENRQKDVANQNACHFRAADDISVHTVSSSDELEIASVEHSDTCMYEKNTDKNIPANDRFGKKEAQHSDEYIQVTEAMEILASSIARTAIIAGITEEKKRDLPQNKATLEPANDVVESSFGPDLTHQAVSKLSKSKRAVICDLTNESTNNDNFDTSELPDSLLVYSSFTVGTHKSDCNLECSFGDTALGSRRKQSQDSSVKDPQEVDDVPCVDEFNSDFAQPTKSTVLFRVRSLSSSSSLGNISNVSTRSSSSTFENDLTSDDSSVASICHEQKFGDLFGEAFLPVERFRNEIVLENVQNQSDLLPDEDGDNICENTFKESGALISTFSSVVGSGDEITDNKSYKLLEEERIPSSSFEKKTLQNSVPALAEDVNTTCDNETESRAILLENDLQHDHDKCRQSFSAHVKNDDDTQPQEIKSSPFHATTEALELTDPLTEKHSTSLKLNYKPAEVVAVKKVELKPLVGTSRVRDIFIEEAKPNASSVHESSKKIIVEESPKVRLSLEKHSFVADDEIDSVTGSTVNSCSVVDKNVDDLIEARVAAGKDSCVDQHTSFGEKSVGEKMESGPNGANSESHSLTTLSSCEKPVSDYNDAMSANHNGNVLRDITGSYSFDRSISLQEQNITQLQKNKNLSSIAHKRVAPLFVEKDLLLNCQSEDEGNEKYVIKSIARSLSEGVFENAEAAGLKYSNFDQNASEKTASMHSKSKQHGKFGSLYTPKPYLASSSSYTSVSTFSRSNVKYSDKERKQQEKQSTIVSFTPTRSEKTKSSVPPKPKNLCDGNKIKYQVSETVGDAAAKTLDFTSPLPFSSTSKKSSFRPIKFNQNTKTRRPTDDVVAPDPTPAAAEAPSKPSPDNQVEKYSEEKNAAPTENVNDLTGKESSFNFSTPNIVSNISSPKETLRFQQHEAIEVAPVFDPTLNETESVVQVEACDGEAQRQEIEIKHEITYGKNCELPENNTNNNVCSEQNSFNPDSSSNPVVVMLHDSSAENKISPTLLNDPGRSGNIVASEEEEERPYTDDDIDDTESVENLLQSKSELRESQPDETQQTAIESSEDEPSIVAPQINTSNTISSSNLLEHEGTIKPTSEDFVLPPPPTSEEDIFTSQVAFTVTSPHQKEKPKSDSTWTSDPGDFPLPPPPEDLPTSPIDSSPPLPTSPSFLPAQTEKPKGFRSVARPVIKKPVSASSSVGEQTTTTNYRLQGESFPTSHGANVSVTPKEQLPQGAVYQTSTKEGEVVHTDTYYPASDQSDPKSTVLERTKTSTLIQAPHHEGIGPVNDSGVPYALRSSVDDSKHWYKNMFKQMHKVEDNEDQSTRTVEPRPYSADSSHPRHTSTEVSKPKKVGRITDYQPARPYVVENEPVKLNLNRRVSGRGSNMNSNNNKNSRLPRSSSLEDFTKMNWNDYFEDVRKPKTRIGKIWDVVVQEDYANEAPPAPQQQVVTNVKPPTNVTSHKPNSTTSYSPSYFTSTKTEEKMSPEPKRVIATRNHKQPAKSHHKKAPENEMRLPARGKYNFAVQTAKEYPVKKGQTVIITRQVDNNWYMVQSVDGSKSGIVPVSYLEIISGSTPAKPLRNGQARAKFNFEGSSSKELSFQKGDEIVLLKKVDDNWYKGKLKGAVGILPTNYIEVLMEPETESKKAEPVAKQATIPVVQTHSRQSSSLSQESSDEPDERERKQRAAFLATSVVKSASPLHSRNVSMHREDMLDVVMLDGASKMAEEEARKQSSELNDSQDHTKFVDFSELDQVVEALSNQNQELPTLHSSTTSNNQLSPPANPLTPSIPSYPSSVSPQSMSPRPVSPVAVDYGQVIGTYVALYAYEASNDDELDLVPGDVVKVVETCDDGWFVGTCQRTGVFGTFPGNYVSPTQT